MDSFPDEFTALGVRYSTVFSDTSLAAKMNHFYVPCIFSTDTATKHKPTSRDQT